MFVYLISWQRCMTAGSSTRTRSTGVVIIDTQFILITGIINLQIRYDCSITICYHLNTIICSWQLNCVKRNEIKAARTGIAPFLYKGKQLLFNHWNFEPKIFSSDCYEGCVFLPSPMNYLLHHPIFMHNTIGLPCSVKKFLVSPFTVRWNKTSLKCSTEKFIYFFLSRLCLPWQSDVNELV